MPTPFKVSVCIVTYNHAKFIRKTLDSILSQKVNFDYEIIVGDDLSKDNTREILSEYQKTHPDKIKLLFQPRNMGNNGSHNMRAVFALATGEYIAQMDGDDYLISNDKLQAQVDLLDLNPNFSGCFHNAYIEHNDDPSTRVPIVKTEKPVFYLDDFVENYDDEEIFFLATSSLMFRRATFYNPPEPAWFHDSVSGDIPRNILLAQKGPIGYVPGFYSVYRKNAGGTSYTDNYQSVDFLYNRILMYENLDKDTKRRFHKRFNYAKSRYFRRMIDLPKAQESYFFRASRAVQYLYLRNAKKAEIFEVFKLYILPERLLGIYRKFIMSFYK